MVTKDGRPMEIGQGTSQGLTTLLFDRNAIGSRCEFDAEIQFEAGKTVTREVNVCKATVVYLAESDIPAGPGPVAAAAPPPAPEAADNDDEDWDFGDDQGDKWQRDEGTPLFQGQIYGDCQALFGGCYQEIPGSGSYPQFLYRVGGTEHSPGWSDRLVEITEMFPTEQSGPSGEYRSRYRVVTFHCKAGTVDYSGYTYNADDGHYLSTDENGGAVNVDPADAGSAYVTMYKKLCE